MLPTIAVATAVGVFHAMTIVSARFHVPLEPLMAAWGAVGCVGGVARRRVGRQAGQTRLAAGPHDVKRVGIEDRLLGAELGRRR
jgi:hypothetical protein